MTNIAERDRAALLLYAETLEAQAKTLEASAAGLRALAAAPVEADRAMNLKQGAAFLGVSPGFIRYAIERGELRATQLGKRCWRVNLSELTKLQRLRGLAAQREDVQRRTA